MRQGTAIQSGAPTPRDTCLSRGLNITKRSSHESDDRCSGSFLAGRGWTDGQDADDDVGRTEGGLDGGGSVLPLPNDERFGRLHVPLGRRICWLAFIQSQANGQG